MVAFAGTAVEPSTLMPPQSFLAGVVLVLSALVSPPAVSSLIEVKVMGCWAVPVALRVPLTMSAPIVAAGVVAS